MPRKGVESEYSLFAELFYPVLQFSLKLIFVRQIEGILGSVDVGIFWQSKLHHRILLLLAKKDPNGGFLKRLFDLTVIVIDVHLHLPYILVCEFVYFQINQNITLKQAVVENQVNDIMILIKSKPLLACLEQEPLS